MWRGPCGFSPTPAAASSPARCCMSAAAPASAACCCKRMTAVPHLHASALPRCAPALSAAVPAAVLADSPAAVPVDSPAAVAAGHAPPQGGPPMTWDVALILLTDGLANGAVYLLAGLGLVLVFSVTRVVFVPFG